MAQSVSLTSSKASGSSRLSLQAFNKSNASEQDKGQDVVPGLLYYEFLPLVRRSKSTGLLEFQEFDDVVERASDWYRQICGYRVVSMETVQFKFRDRDPASSSSSGEAKGYRSSRSDEDGTRLSAQKHYYGDGLRVWLFPCEAHINGGVELGYLDLEPQLVEQPAGCIRYEAVPDLLERFNAEQGDRREARPGKGHRSRVARRTPTREDAPRRGPGGRLRLLPTLQPAHLLLQRPAHSRKDTGARRGAEAAGRLRLRGLHVRAQAGLPVAAEREPAQAVQPADALRQGQDRRSPGYSAFPQGAHAGSLPEGPAHRVQHVSRERGRVREPALSPVPVAPRVHARPQPRRPRPARRRGHPRAQG
ncbi:uncharacterized protein LOC119431995 isoform X1 [Dermacentor silvarum]|uniref:uncharacterized protein LOC119431995 isoform X1 n=1 Tax=Dermacentor silvarum TaxID=543639 RepID=UPI00189A8D88|nr:uncharacterized protein LOC119431995 isoform X1 [Dermacentor silvarum]